METFGILGFIFGCFAFTQLYSIMGRVKELETKVEKLEKIDEIILEEE